MSCRSNMMLAGQRGAGLIEVSISLLVIAIGALGLANLQIAAKRVGHDAIQRTQASALAMDMLERMRGNRAGLYGYRTRALGAATGSQLAAPDRKCDLQSCTSGQLSTWDLWQWERALNGAYVTGSAGGLVNPLACVVVSGRLVTVKIAWEGFRKIAHLSTGLACGKGADGPGGRPPERRPQQVLQLSSYIGEDG